MATLVESGETRGQLLRRALRLEWLTVGWNVAEGLIAVAAALAAGSVALLGFGIDSFVESASGGILVWRLMAEKWTTADPHAIERLDRHARRLVALSLFALALYVAADASLALRRTERPEASLVGIALSEEAGAACEDLARQCEEAAGICKGPSGGLRAAPTATSTGWTSPAGWFWRESSWRRRPTSRWSLPEAPSWLFVGGSGFVAVDPALKEERWRRAGRHHSLGSKPQVLFSAEIPARL